MTDTAAIGRRTALGMALASGATGIARRSAAQAPQEVKIAMLVPLSGPWARSGILEKLGAEMAIDDINTAGGIKSAWWREVAPDAVRYAGLRGEVQGRRDMVSQEPDLVGGFGCWLSSFTLAVTEVTERVGLPWATLSYSDLITGRGYRYVFQTTHRRQPGKATAADRRRSGAEGHRQTPDQDRDRRRQHCGQRQLPEGGTRLHAEGPRPYRGGRQDLHAADRRRDDTGAADPQRAAGKSPASCCHPTFPMTSCCSTSLRNSASPGASCR